MLFQISSQRVSSMLGTIPWGKHLPQSYLWLYDWALTHGMWALVHVQLPSCLFFFLNKLAVDVHLCFPFCRLETEMTRVGLEVVCCLWWWNSSSNYSKSLNCMLWKCCTQYDSKFGNLTTGHRIGKASFHSNPKERQYQRTFRPPYRCAHFTS